MGITVYDSDLYLYFPLFFVLFFLVFSIFMLLNREKGKESRDALNKIGNYDFSEFKKRLDGLLRFGVDGSGLVISFPEQDQKFRFDKYIRKKGDFGLLFRMPERYFSNPLIRLLKQYCSEKEISWPKYEQQSGEPDSLSLDCGADSERAFHLLRFMAVDLAGVPENAKQDWQYFGNFSSDEPVDDPVVEGLTTQELETKRWERMVAGGLLLRFVSHSLFIFGFVGMIYAISVSIGAHIFSWDMRWNVINLDVGGLSFRAKVFDLVCIALYLTGMSCSYAAKIPAKSKKTHGNNDESDSVARSGAGASRMQKFIARGLPRLAVLLGLLMLTWAWH